MTFDDLWDLYIVDSCEFARIPRDSVHHRCEPEGRYTLSENVEEIDITDDEADKDKEEKKQEQEPNGKDENNA